MRQRGLRKSDLRPLTEVATAVGNDAYLMTDADAAREIALCKQMIQFCEQIIGLCKLMIQWSAPIGWPGSKLMHRGLGGYG